MIANSNEGRTRSEVRYGLRLDPDLQRAFSVETGLPQELHPQQGANILGIPGGGVVVRAIHPFAVGATILGISAAGLVNTLGIPDEVAGGAIILLKWRQRFSEFPGIQTPDRRP
jgi:hypothetical protein